MFLGIRIIAFRAHALGEGRYQRSRLHPLEYQGWTYDSKTIVGVVYGKQHGAPLRAGEFSGGLATVVRLLRNLQFFVRDTAHPARTLTIGKTYCRKDLLGAYGGQLRGASGSRRNFRSYFCFGGQWKLYGYQDGWAEDEELFEYTGEGQKGNMTFRAGNKTIRDHRKNGKDLLLH